MCIYIHTQNTQTHAHLCHSLICLEFCLSVKTTEGNGKQLLLYIYLYAHIHTHISLYFYIQHIQASRNITNLEWFVSLLSTLPHSHLVMSWALSPKSVRKSGLTHVWCSQSKGAGSKGPRGLSVQICLQSLEVDGFSVTPIHGHPI